MVKIYTRTGDAGQTSLFTGERVPKDHLRLHVYGTLDELNAVLGLALAAEPGPEVAHRISRLQTLLFILCSDLATPLPARGEADRVTRIDARHIRYLEADIDVMSAVLPPLGQFILPGGCPDAAALHLARTVCRRAERWLIRLRAETELGDHVPVLVNRLSDYLFTLARYANHLADCGDKLLDRGFPEIDHL
ncbi:MAG TPA: cob(I)yrinic acid a,c-diamide adenosyltransferase [Acidobacteriota bacterium]|nr:cob(I)yrinic acid a,c-diamide adenosyltransferase [Acidobacteriota bacterium]HOT01689.1 cob(I)yrinic acid a,c-diamide adenosyltransferase [Acidobacteriota bacterium]HQF85919.1 cob(I)yrinic acid a,c-diamide adenosyltransferase [Acidobacteriota bacterium]HQG90837.1 cob(I)yrinic acid a,c-diamide adenosyltransferase [Acidobacteriota bacterium]